MFLIYIQFIYKLYLINFSNLLIFFTALTLTSSLLFVRFCPIKVGEDRLIRFSGCKSGAACSVILRGASSHLLDEAERSLHDALCVLTETVKETRVICGGGCMEMAMANAIDKYVASSNIDNSASGGIL